MRASALKLIQRNIAEFGYHIYLVSGGPSPRFAYTIGLSESLGAELVFAGGTLYTGDEVKRTLDEIAHRLRKGTTFDSAIHVEPLGSFLLRKVHRSWVTSLLLGAVDFYSAREVSAYQIVPDQQHWTVDVPNLGVPWSATSEPIWKWLHEEWPYPVSPRSVATTNLEALRGGRVTEAARWEEDQWELFAGSGPGVSPDEIRVVPLGTLLGADESLGAVVELEIGKGLWREAEDGEWHAWG